MASTLLNTSFKNRLFYLLLLLGLGIFAAYMVLFREPPVVENMQQRAFELNFAAFKNGIRLANYKFIVKTANFETNGSASIHIGGLEFNQHGFPIAARVSKASQVKPYSVQDCIDVWYSVLGPLRPELAKNPIKSGYWSYLSDSETCGYRSSEVKDQVILYDTVKGIVSLSAINS